jgi:hypothetical protein
MKRDFDFDSVAPLLLIAFGIIGLVIIVLHG